MAYFSNPATGLDWISPRAGLIRTATWFMNGSQKALTATEYIFGAMFPRTALPTDVKIQSEDQARSNSGSSGSGSSVMVLTIVILIFSIIIGFRKSKKGSSGRVNNNYLPPKIKAEGEGIKRGLTSIEAGVLMEQPMDKIISMIIFSLVKKDAIEVKSEKPLEILVSDPLPEGLYDYELGFIEAMSCKKDSEKSKNAEGDDQTYPGRQR